MRKLVLFCGAVVLATAASAAVAAAAGTKSMTMQLVEKSTSFKYVDNPPKGKNVPPSAGDQFAFTSDLQSKAGKKLGSISVTCTVTTGGRHAVSNCTGVMQLQGGQIAAIALVPLDNSKSQPDISIVGGTGAYTGATGTLHTVSRGANSPYSDDTLHLTLPT